MECRAPGPDVGTTGNYNGVVVADNPAYFAPGQLTGLYAYEAQYNVRQVDGTVTGFPAISLGVTSATRASRSTGPPNT